MRHAFLRLHIPIQLILILLLESLLHVLLSVLAVGVYHLLSVLVLLLLQVHLLSGPLKIDLLYLFLGLPYLYRILLIVLSVENGYLPPQLVLVAGISEEGRLLSYVLVFDL